MKTVFIAALCVLALALPLTYAQDIDEKDVLVLGDDTFEQALKDHPNLLVEFYAPWCGHCKNLAPEYAKAATELAGFEPAVKLAKVDATVHPKKAGEHGVRGYPTLKFFVDGQVQDYNGGRKAPEIVSWLKKKVGPPAEELASADAVESFVNKATASEDGVVVVGFFDASSDDAKNAFIAAARTNDEVQFGITGDSAAFDLFSVKSPAVVLFKAFDEKKAVFEGDFTADAIKEFVASKSSPLVQEFTRSSSQKIFGGARGRLPKMFLFHDKNDGGAADLLAQFKTSAEKYIETFVFSNVHSGKNSGNDHILNYFGITEDKLPQLQILDGSGQKKYFTEDGLAGLDKFIDDFNNGKAQQAFKSEPLPADNSGPVTTLVAKNFNDIVYDQERDVLVEFYAPWCGHCKKLAPIWDQLGEAFKDIDSVVIAKLDATANESPEIADQGVRGFPTIKFFPKGHPAGTVGKEFSGDRTLASFAKYIKENAVSEFQFPDIDTSAPAKPVKSEDVPTEQPNGVLKVVAKTFKEMVVDSEKDVLAEFYAPWCGHCKKLAPIFEELAQKFKNVDTVDIVAVDMTANESPELEALGVRGYPTLKFFPAGKGSKPVDYNMGRTVDDFTKFLTENAVHKFSLDDSAKEDL
eukprot:TRINITY_DN2553_c0_g2_i1.p1 TRINITY_DN2553_c0_g2~~TRINITY_DN2553_c0_g2_i1.p1  ORF type:complete len:636 (+),score=282.36 TRINITY_DN2553_c0_g2_i1:57-1964(+)